MMKRLSWFTFGILVLTLAVSADENADIEAKEKAAAERIAELDTLWAKVSASVKAGDFDAYKSTCHDEGVLVAGTSKKSLPLSKALAGWKKEFDQTKAGKMEASVVFRFTERMNDATTAHETGMFLYSAKTDEKDIAEPIHFEALLVKKADGWKVLMEYQKSLGTMDEWNALKPD